MNKTVLFLLATTIGLGLISLHLVRTLRTERQQVELLQARLEQTQRAQENAQSQGAQWFIETPFGPPTPAATDSSATESPAPAAAPAPTRNAPPPPSPVATSTDVTQAKAPSRDERMRMIRDSLERRRAMLQDPEYRDAMRAQRKLMYARMYPDLAQELDVSAEQLDQFLTLLADQDLQATQEPVPWGDNPPDQAQLQERMRQVQLRHEKNEAALASLLGPTKLQGWKDYQATLGVRQQVAQLRTLLTNKGVPLQEEMVKPLLRALADEQQRIDKEANTGRVSARIGLLTAPAVYAGSVPASSAGLSPADLRQRQLEHMAQYYQRLRDAASSVLSPEQLEVFEEEQSAQLKMQEVQMRMMRKRAESQGGLAPHAVATQENIAVSR